jgi:hypothetical protein
MNRTTVKSALLLVPCLAGGSASTARAADEDVQLWTTQSASVPLTEHITGSLDVSERYREGGDQLLSRASADYKLSDAATVGGGLAYVVTVDGANETRPHQQLTLTFGPVALRSRVEERFFDDADRMELRLRQKATLTWPLAEEWKASLAGELLYIAQSQDRDADPRVDQWRANAAIARRLADKLEGTIGYLAILSPRDGRPDRLSHVAQLTVTLKH